MRVALHPCYILHNRAYRETSLLLDVFSRQHGRVGLIAKGGRTQKNHKRALLQPGRRVNISWTARRELGALISVEPCQTDAPPGGGRLLSVFYINELLVKLLHKHEAHPELFDVYDEAITGLSGGASEQVILRLFEKRLLEALGYGLALDSDVEGNPIKPNEDYNYRIEQGPVLYETPLENSVRVSGQTLLALSKENPGKDRVLNEAKQLMRMMIGHLLGGRPLVSRELYKYILSTHTEKAGRK